MDRDKRWARVAPVYQLLTTGDSPHHFPTALEALDNFYDQQIYDEFIPPTKLDAMRPIMAGDAVFYFNFRSDRARQLTQALITDEFDGFERAIRPKISKFISMTPYAKFLATQSAFPQQPLHNTLGEVLAHHGLRQLRIAETEKYAHVTFFLNGGSEQVFPLEERILIPSPAIATYDLQPEMNAPIVAATIIQALHEQRYDVIICNFANADMVGHSGNMAATIQAIEALDNVMHDIGVALQKVKGQMIITADHGNAECMYDETTQQAHTAHTEQPVPFVYVGQDKWQLNASDGGLIDIAPTVLTLLDIHLPSEMQGKTLLVKKNAN
jgi:2,3-bisphosphoglycerate-independent phosphoglycerate mutase